MPLRLRYNTRLPIILGLLGIYSLWRMSHGTFFIESRPTTLLLLGALALLIALLILFVPCADVDMRVTTVYGFIPFFKREFHYYSLNDLVLDGDWLYYRDGAQWERIPIFRQLIRSDDWIALEKVLTRI